MSNFWREVDQSAKAQHRYSGERQLISQRALDQAKKFYSEVSDPGKLSAFGITTQLRDKTVSFRKEGLEVLAVNFGVGDRDAAYISSPIIEYLKLGHSSEEVMNYESVESTVATWLGRSLNALQRNRDVLVSSGVL